MSVRRTILTSVQRVMYQLNETPPATLVGNAAPSALQLLNLMYAVCEELRQSRVWVQQKKTYSFDTVSGQRSYQLPKDFYAALPRTQWNTDENNLLVGPVSDANMTMRVYGEVPSTTNFTYRIFGPDENPNSAAGQFYVDPEPSSAVSLYFEYLTSSLFVPQDWAPSTAYTTTNPDWVHSNGNWYVCVTNGTSSATTAPSSTASGAITDGTAEWNYHDDTYHNPQADSDTPLFDSDLVELGLKAKFLQHKGGDFAMFEDEFQRRIDQAVHRYKGSFVGNMGLSYTGPRYHIPYRSWSI